MAFENLSERLQNTIAKLTGKGKVSEADKTFMKAMAKFEGVSLSELIRTKTLEALEDEYDARVADLAYQEYLEDLEKGVEPVTWEEMMHDLGLEDE